MSGRNWRYKLTDNFTTHSAHLKGVWFSSKWGEIEDGHITIYRGYAWDGCSPAINIGGLWLGVPDGKLNSDGRPKAFYASLVHDFLCQFSNKIAIDKQETVELFREMLIQGGFSIFRANLYAKAVDIFGPQEWGCDV